MDFQNYARAKNKKYENVGFDQSDIADLTTYFKEHVKISVNNKPVEFEVTKAAFEKHEDSFILLVEMTSGKVTLQHNTSLKISDITLLSSISGQRNIVNFYQSPDQKMPKPIALDKKNPESEILVE